MTKKKQTKKPKKQKPTEVDDIMEELGVDKETAWLIAKDREDKKIMETLNEDEFKQPEITDTKKPYGFPRKKYEDYILFLHTTVACKVDEINEYNGTYWEDDVWDEEPLDKALEFYKSYPPEEQFEIGMIYPKNHFLEVKPKLPLDIWIEQGHCKIFEHDDLFKYKHLPLKNIGIVSFVEEDLEDTEMFALEDGMYYEVTDRYEITEGAFKSIELKPGRQLSGEELTKLKIPIQKLIEEGTLKKVTKYWKQIPKLSEKLQRQNYFINTERGYKFIAPKLGGDIVFHNFDLDSKNFQVNRGWLITTDNQEIWLYNGRYWDNNGEIRIRNIIQEILKERCLERYKTETLNWIKDTNDIHIDRNKFDSKTRYIPLENGIYDLETNKLLDFHPGFLVTSVLPIYYNKNAKCPKFLKFITEVTHPEDLDFIQEYIGYLFYRKYTFAIFVLLLGHGRNGKTTLIKVLTYALGSQNVEHLPLHKLATDDVARVRLYRKWANLCADIETYEVKRTGVLKQLTGGDPMYARGLYQDGFNFENVAKLLFASNELPTVYDKTSAMEERFAVVEFPNSFPRGSPNCNPFLYDELIEEIPGIFNWAMEGLQRLLKNRNFSEYKTIEDTKQYLSATKDVIYKFIKEHITIDIGNDISKDKVYQTYTQFAVKDNKNPLPSNHFSIQFKQYASLYFRSDGKDNKLFYLEEGSIMLNKVRTRIWKGINLINVKEDSKQQKVVKE